MSNSKKHILVADNDPDTLAAVQFNMKMAGYKVFAASNPEQANEVLDEQIIHLAIIDMRLRNDKELEYSGFDVAKRVPDHIPFIIYTAFEDTESIRLALGKVGARESLDKKKPGTASELLETVNRLFKTDVKVNFALEIQGTLTCEEIADKLEVACLEGARPPVADICQIFQALFYGADSIFISRILSPQLQSARGQSGSVVVLVRPHYKDGWGEARVVKFCETAEVKREEKKYLRIEPFLGGNRLAVLCETAYSRTIGGLIYTLIEGEEWDKIQLFNDYFQNSDEETICISLERFFFQTFGNIFANASARPIDLTEGYCNGFHLTPQKLTAAMQGLRPGELTEPRLHFYGLEETFLNPVRWILIDGEFRKFEVNSRTCLCHGDLHGRNILVNSDGHYWLIDFARVAVGHALRDFVELETDLKFNILKDVDLVTLLPFECKLLAPERFQDAALEVKFKSESLTKAYKVITHLRQVAAKSLDLNGDMSEYYQALLFNTLNMLRLKHIQAAKKEHALFSAALLCERLEHWPEWSFAKIGGSPTS